MLENLTVLNCEYCEKEYSYDSTRKFSLKFCSMLCKKLSFIGRRFGRLIVVGLSEKRQGTKVVYLCRCVCGNLTDVTKSNLISGGAISCGCYKAEYLGITNTKTIVLGIKFGRLTVVERQGSDREGKALYLCRCDCGNNTIATGKDLRSGHRTGCSSRCRLRTGNLRHGLTKTSWGRRYLERIRRESEMKWTPEMDLSLKDMFPLCVVCGSTEILCVDHVIPLTDGGILEPGNVVILCRLCNLRKSNKSLWEFTEYFSGPIRKGAVKFAELYF